MQQLEIKFFWPLTEQINLELDYTPCEKYQEEKRKKVWVGSIVDTGNFVLSSGMNTTTGFQIDIDQNQITVVSKDKPNLIKKIVYKALGMNWRVK
jgi:hypothetical protein